MIVVIVKRDCIKVKICMGRDIGNKPIEEPRRKY